MSKTPPAHVCAMQDTIEWAMSFQGSFWGRHKSQSPSSGWLGTWQPGEESEIGFLPAILAAHLRQAGYEPEGIFTTWAEIGWIRQDNGRNPKVELKGEHLRMICIRPDCLDDEDD